MAVSPIEKVSEADYDQIIKVWEASVRATHHFLSEDDILFYRELIRSKYLHLVTLHCIRDEQQEIAGFLGTTGEKIEMLFVSPEQLGKGIGKALLQFAINELGLSKVDVNDQNVKACRFYQHFGFSVVGRSEVDGTGRPYPILFMELS